MDRWHQPVLHHPHLNGKGAAGQAIQNMNIIFDLPETTGLMIPAMYP